MPGYRGILTMLTKKFVPLLMIVFSMFIGAAFAEGETGNEQNQQQTEQISSGEVDATANTNVATTSYVAGAYNALLRRTQQVQSNKVEAELVDNGTGNVLTGMTVSANDGVTLQRANVQIPVGSANSTTYTPIWVE